ncbi:MAG: hypothetical protein ACKV2O_11140 [Acidimicrobiales bacterium]
MATQMRDRAQHTMRVDKDTYQQLLRAAEERGVSANKLITMALQDFLDRLIPIEETKLTR